MSKHTPGPWEAKVIDTSYGEPAYWHIVQRGKNGVIGDVQSVNFADALLIAAAPDLLDALQRVMRHIPDNAGGASLSDDMHRAKKALAKAASA